MKYTLDILPYSQLSLDQFHDLVALRIAVFVIEQDCPYQELDGHDKLAQHLLATNEAGKVVATLRILAPGIAYEQYAIGRVVVAESERGSGLGDRIMTQAMAHIDAYEGTRTPIKLSAQEHLEGYYRKHGFERCGDGYLEDGIPHIPMLRSA